MASDPYLALAAPCTISIWSTFSVPRRCSSSPAPEYFARSPITGCPSTRIRVCLGSAPRMDTPTRPIESTVRDTPVSLKTMSSTDLACFFSMSAFVIIVFCCDSYFASSSAGVAWTIISRVAIRSSAPYTGIVSHDRTAHISNAYLEDCFIISPPCISTHT